MKTTEFSVESCKDFKEIVLPNLVFLLRGSVHCLPEPGNPITKAFEKITSIVRSVFVIA